jgi:hypothetical protein
VKLVAAILAAAAVLLLVTGGARAQEIRLPVAVSRGSVMVRAEEGMDSLASRVAGEARGALAEIAADLPDQAVPRRVEIRLVKRAEDLSRAAPEGRGAPPWAIGVAYPDLGVVVIAYRRGPMPADVRSTVRHELAHLALGAALGARAPRWLHEGFAYLHSSDFSLDRTRTLTGMAWSGDVIPLVELDDSFPAAEMAAARAYAESYDFVSFLAHRGRSAEQDDDGNRWPFRRFLSLVAGGTPIDQAARQAFSADLAHLFAEWKETLRQRYLMLPAGLLGVAIWILAAFLLVLAYLRKKRLNRQTLARWDDEERGEPPPPLLN